MLPTNSGRAKDRGCVPLSSNCVVWQGPDLHCIDLCKGDTISDVVAKLAEELCTLIEMFDLAEFDFSCLELQPSQAPSNAGELIQILITRICALENITPTSGNASTTCPDNCIVPIADCFYYIDAFGDTITTMSLVDYVLAIGNRICSILDDILLLQTDITTLQEQINGNGVDDIGLVAKVQVLDDEKVDEDALQYQVSTLTDPSAGTQFITDALRSVENSLIGTQNSLGSSTQLYQNILKAANIGSEDKMFGSGNMNSITGWTMNVQTGSESIGNLWLSIHDLRAAVSYMQENCCSTGCSDIFLNFRAILDVQFATTFLTVYTDGSTGFTGEWKECTGTTKITITDALGNSSTFSTSLIALIDDPSGFQVDITPTSIDPTQNLTITATTCFTNTVSETQCEKDYVYTILATPDCPATVLTIYSTAVAYQFNAAAGYTYIINVYYSGGPTPVASQIVSSPGVVVANSIFGLLADTAYDLEVVLVDGSGTETPCARQPFTTLPDNCVAPINPVVILTI